MTGCSWMDTRKIPAQNQKWSSISSSTKEKKRLSISSLNMWPLHTFLATLHRSTPTVHKLSFIVGLLQANDADFTHANRFFLNRIVTSLRTRQSSSAAQGMILIVMIHRHSRIFHIIWQITVNVNTVMVCVTVVLIRTIVRGHTACKNSLMLV